MKLDKIHGVNLGGWLVLEKWMLPKLFEGTKAICEYTLCEELGAKAETVMRNHWESYITEKDFNWLKSVGINAVRIPVGYWIFGDVKPFVGGIDILDRAVETTAKYEVYVLLDVHGAPGSQNGEGHSGHCKEMKWHTRAENIESTIIFVEKLAKRYKNNKFILGIQLLNEPAKNIPMEILKDYYKRAYKAVRRIIPDEDYLIVMHDSFRALEWKGFMPQEEYPGATLDSHLYFCYQGEDDNMDIYQELEKQTVRNQKYIDDIKKQMPTIIGEWSLALNPNQVKDFDEYQFDIAYRAFGAAQLLVYERTKGWFFWSYKLEAGSPYHPWSFRTCVEKGWLPGKF